MKPTDLIVKATLESFPPDDIQSTFFINASLSPNLNRLKSALTCQTYWRGEYLVLKKEGYEVDASFSDKRFDRILLSFPKNITEGRNMLNQALSSAISGGFIIAGAANDAGGKRLPGLFKDRGIPSEKISKARCTICVAGPVTADSGPTEDVSEPAFQTILENAYISCPGIFNWDKVDKGSSILASCLPDSLSGVGADFGCGYGYLSRQILKNNSTIRKLYAIDADWRAVEACKKNVPQAQAECLWHDVTLETLPENLDFIVMNPPFHTGKEVSHDLGLRFIEKAAASLKKRGELWMVANAHLPYETRLGSLFTRVEHVRQDNGFKVIKATR